MGELEGRFQAGRRVDMRPGRRELEMAPDLEQIARDACKFLWRRPGLSMEQRSMATLSAVTALGREGQLWEHIEDGLTLGLSAERIVEVFIHLFFYVGSPAARSALVVAKQVFDARGIEVNPQRIHDPDEDPEELFRRGSAKRRELMEDPKVEASGEIAEFEQSQERFSREYLWGSIWTRPGLDMQSRCICTLSALTALGRDRIVRHYVGASLRMGLTKAQIMEIFFHLSFYTGFPTAWSAAIVAKEVFRSQ